jgi:hypothetical protein
MIDANRHELEFEGRLHRFIQDKPEVVEKAFVTKVYYCSAYAQLITDYGQSGQVYVGFKGSNSTPTATPAVSASDASNGVNPTWLTSGTWTTGKYCAWPPPYTPLATLRQVTPKEPAKGYRGSSLPEIPDDQEMEDYIPPWCELDEQGDEIGD